MKHDVQHMDDKSDVEIILGRVIERNDQWCYVRSNS